MLVRMSEIQDAYASAWDEWLQTEDRDLWEPTSGDGFADAAR
jgi:hypothetical protein